MTGHRQDKTLIFLVVLVQGSSFVVGIVVVVPSTRSKEASLFSSSGWCENPNNTNFPPKESFSLFGREKCAHFAFQMMLCGPCKPHQVLWEGVSASSLASINRNGLSTSRRLLVRSKRRMLIRGAGRCLLAPYYEERDDNNKINSFHFLIFSYSGIPPTSF